MTLSLYLDCHPRGVRLTLTCDAGDCTNEQTFTQADYVAQRAAATKAGWLERQTSAGRLFLCPQCSESPGDEH